ncbi:MAG: hypothetical protein JST92_27195, partial [Deltaproteobacteria bacterium]|nr:hypothetical protein [Deltaproteobacteria bacterium]
GVVNVDTASVKDSSQTVASLNAAFFTSPAGGVSLSYSLLNGGLVYPEDFTSLELLTAYVNVERARAAFNTWGLGDLKAANLFAHTDLTDETGLTPLKNGEIYYPPLGAFFFPKATEGAQQLPVHFNLGAVTHGLALQAIQAKAWGGRPNNPSVYGGTADPDAVVGNHVWQSVAMGLADFLGAAAGEDPEWFEKSLQQEAAARDLDLQRCGDASMLAALEAPDRPGDPPYDPYPLGTVLGAALWEASGDSRTEAASDTLGSLNPLGQASSASSGNLSLATALDTLVGTASSDRKPALCGLFINRFSSLSVTSLPSCSDITPTPPLEPCQ